MKKIFLSLGATLVSSFLAMAPAHSGTVVEYYNATLDHYFNTSYGPEIQALDGGVHKGWVRTGLTFQTFDAGASMYATSSPVCRFYGNPAVGLDSHFYSASLTECEDVKKKFATEWLLEAEDLFRVHPVDPNTGICPTGTKAVYRLWNNRPDVNHRYTTEAAVVDAMLAKGYVLEGNGNPSRPVAFCAANVAAPPPPAGAPVCTITKSSQFAVIGTPVTLTANCTGSPTTYAWINCTGTGRTCTVNATAPATVTYAVVATNAVATSAQAPISLNWQYPASAAPVCQISASTTTPQLGAPLVLTSNCSQAPASYQWMGCSALMIDVCNLLSECSSSSPTCSPIGTAAGSIYYALRASNNAGTSPKDGMMVAWGGSATQPPPSVGNAPVCQLGLNPDTRMPAVGTSMTLTASCTGSPTSYEWAGSGCNTNSNTCTTTEVSAGQRWYSVAGRNANGLGTSVSVMLDWQQPGPPVCTVSAGNVYPVVNSTVTLTARCSQSPTSFQWTGCSSTTDTCQATSATAGQVVYEVKATNAYGSGTGSQTLNWGTPPPVGTDYCAPNAIRGSLPWRGDLATSGFGDEDFVGELVAKSGALTHIGAVEFRGGIVPRVMTISTSPCDFRGINWGVSWMTDASTPSVAGDYPIALSHGIDPALPVTLTPGVKYYVNIRNVRFADGAPSCSTSCDMLITVKDY